MISKKDAKDIACHFVEKTEIRATPALMRKSINQAKSLLESEYTKEEIIKVIDYLVDYRDVDMYSLGYVNSSIHQVINEVNKHEAKQKAKELMKDAKVQGVKDDGKSTERNKQKLSRFGVCPRVREKSFSDLFKAP